MYMQDVRCPSCQRWLGRGAFTMMELLCRCKTRVLAMPDETVVLTTAASVSKTFDGTTYLNGVMMS